MRKFKLFMAWEFEEEEKWLAEMEAQGLHFKKYRLFWYEFEKGEPNRYQYRLEMLPNLPAHPESRRYIEFMEEMGVEMVDSYLRWVYFRKKWDDEPFEIYSDADNRIRHLRGIVALLVPVLLILLANIFSVCHVADGWENMVVVPVIAALSALAVSAAFGVIKIIKKIYQLEKYRHTGE